MRRTVKGPRVPAIDCSSFVPVLAFHIPIQPSPHLSATEYGQNSQWHVCFGKVRSQNCGRDSSSKCIMHTCNQQISPTNFRHMLHHKILSMMCTALQMVNSHHLSQYTLETDSQYTRNRGAQPLGHTLAPKGAAKTSTHALGSRAFISKLHGLALQPCYQSEVAKACLNCPTPY